MYFCMDLVYGLLLAFWQATEKIRYLNYLNSGDAIGGKDEIIQNIVRRKTDSNDSKGCQYRPEEAVNEVVKKKPEH